MLSGDNGILQKATDAKTKTERQSVVEQARTDVLGYQAENKYGDLEKSQLKTVLETYFKYVPTELPDGEELSNLELTTLDKYGTHTIKVSEIYNGSIKGNNTGNSSSNIAGTEVEKPNNWTSLQGKAISDGNGTAIPLPTGFYYVGGDYSTGLVISDKENDSIDASGTSMGNQFVWIPVSNEETLNRLDTNYIDEPYNNGYEVEVSEFNTMKTQVLKYGGFYIGRFEAGINSTTLRDSATTDQTVVVKKGVAPYNYVDWGASLNDAYSIIQYEHGEDWEEDYYTFQAHGAVYLSKNMYSGSTSITSNLVYGCQWDAMCRYIGDYTRTTPTKSNLEITGNVNSDVSKNIYDLAGNCREWDMDVAYDMYRVTRGGDYITSVSIDTCFTGDGEGCMGNKMIGFRVAIYIK